MGHRFREQLWVADDAAESLQTDQTIGEKNNVSHVLGTTVAVHTSVQFPSVPPPKNRQQAGEKLGAWNRCYRRMLPSKPINGHPEVRDEVVGGRRRNK